MITPKIACLTSLHSSAHGPGRQRASVAAAPSAARR
jgi:hypothetical protein